MARRFALVIGNSRYDDPHLGRLKAPEVDVDALERVLTSPAIGQFDDVIALRNEGCARVRKEVARFYEQRQSDDLLFLYFSGHGVKDEQGHLYLALRDTELSLLAGTAVETAFISGRMDRSFSKRQVVVLDCCHSGAFARGSKSSELASVGTAEAFEGTGLGRVILTATDATQYAWEGDQVTGETQSSLFTHFLVDGLRSGAADQDGDGVITVDELYNYVRDQVVIATPLQRPLKWTYRQQGDIIIAQNPFATRSTLPATYQDDRRTVASAAAGALKVYEEASGNRPGTASAGPAGDRRWNEQPLAENADDRPEIRPSDVFISYAHEDRDHAKALAEVLSEQGWKVWWDRKIAPGESFDTVIERELRTCKCAIVLWSEHSVDARWVRNEARRAARRQVLVPILINAVELPLEFENLQAADLTTWKAPGKHPELDIVMDRVRELAPIPVDRLARTAVEAARQRFATGDRKGAMALLAEFRPAHSVVTAALAKLQAEAKRIEEARREAALQEQIKRDEAERQRALTAAHEQIQGHLGRGDFTAAERALDAAETQFGAAALVGLREQWRTQQAEAKRIEEAEKARIEKARREAARQEQKKKEKEAERQRALAAAEDERVRRAAAALAESQAEAKRIEEAKNARAQERERIEKAQREAARQEQKRKEEEAERQRALAKAESERARQAEAKRIEEAEKAHTQEQQHAAVVAPPRSHAIHIAVAAGAVIVVAMAMWRASTPTPPASARDTQTPPPPVAVSPVSRELDVFRSSATAQVNAGQRDEALASAVAGLKIDPNDAALTEIVAELLRLAELASDQAKRQALDARRDLPPVAMLSRGIQEEAAAANYRRAGNNDASVRSYWSAAEAFTKAAEEYRKTIDDERARQAQRAPNGAPNAKAAADAKTAAVKAAADKAAADKAAADKVAADKAVADKAAADKAAADKAVADKAAADKAAADKAAAAKAAADRTAAAKATADRAAAEKAAADRAAKAEADRLAKQQEEERQRVAETQVAERAAEQVAARRFFAEVEGRWTRRNEEPGTNARTITEEELTIAPDCSGVLKRTLLKQSKGYAGWKTDSRDSQTLTFRCSRSGEVTGDIRGPLTLRGNSLVLGDTTFRRP